MSGSFVYYRKGKGPNRDGTGRAAAYEKQKDAVLSIIRDAQDGKADARKLLEKDLRIANNLRRREPGILDVQGTPLLNNMSIAYAAGDMIGVELLPLLGVQKVSGQIVSYERRDRLQKPKTKGRGERGDANERESRRSRVNYSCEADQFKGHIETATVMNEDAPLNELVDLVEDVNHDMELNREREIVTLVTTTTNYATANRTTLTAGAGRWDEAGSNIRKNLLDGMAAMWHGNGSSYKIAWTSLEVWNVVRTHPDHLALLSLGDRGMLSAEQFCEIYDLDGLMVSDLRVDTANIAQTASYSRLWGNNFGIMRVSSAPQLRNATFGFTLRWMPGAGAKTPDGMSGLPQGVFSQMWWDREPGPFGSYYYKRSHFEHRKIIAADTAYLWVTPIN